MYMMPRPHLSEAHRCVNSRMDPVTRGAGAHSGDDLSNAREAREAPPPQQFAEIEARVNGTFFAPVEGGLRFQKIDRDGS